MPSSAIWTLHHWFPNLKFLSQQKLIHTYNFWFLLFSFVNFPFVCAHTRTKNRWTKFNFATSVGGAAIIKCCARKRSFYLLFHEIDIFCNGKAVKQSILLKVLPVHRGSEETSAHYSFVCVFYFQSFPILFISYAFANSTLSQWPHATYKRGKKSEKLFEPVTFNPQCIFALQP